MNLVHKPLSQYDMKAEKYWKMGRSENTYHMRYIIVQANWGIKQKGMRHLLYIAEGHSTTGSPREEFYTQAVKSRTGLHPLYTHFTPTTFPGLVVNNTLIARGRWTMALKKYSQIRYGIHSTLWRVTAVTQVTHKNFTHRYIATSLFYSGVAQVTDYKVTDYKLTR